MKTKTGIRPQRTARFYYLKILRLKGDPQSLARGLTVGVAIGILPILPLQSIIILFLAPLFRGNSIAGLLAGFLISNPLTLVPQYYIAWTLGKLIYPVDLSWFRVRDTLDLAIRGDISFTEKIQAISALGYNYLAILLLGGVAMAIPLAIVCYPLSLRLFSLIHEKREQRRQRLAESKS